MQGSGSGVVVQRWAVVFALWAGSVGCSGSHAPEQQGDSAGDDGSGLGSEFADGGTPPPERKTVDGGTQGDDVFPELQGMMKHEDDPKKVDLPDLSACPDEQPSDGSACSPEALICTYGDNPRPECRASARCRSGSWEVRPADSCAQPPDDYCPPDPPEGSCQALDDNGLPAGQDGRPGVGDSRVGCAYPKGVFCFCRECPERLCDNGPGWECTPPPTDSECPASVPNVGEPCPTTGLACDYGDPCVSGARRICRLGVWYPLDESCST